MDLLLEKGAISFWLNSDVQGWITNNHGYNFGMVENHGIKINGYKTPEKQITFIISGPMYSSTAISIPITNEIINKALEQPDSKSRNSIHVVYTWEGGTGKLYLNAIEMFKFELTLIEFDTFEFKISGEGVISYKTTANVIMQIGDVLNAIYSFQKFTHHTEIEHSLYSGINQNLFSLVESKSGSLVGTFRGVKEAVCFLKNNIIGILAIFNGHSKRIAEAYVIEKETKAGISQQQLKQENIKTMNDALKLVENIFMTLEKTGQEISPEQKQSLINNYVLPPIHELGQELMDKNLHLSITDSQKPKN